MLTLDDDVAEIDADAVKHAPIFGHARVPLCHQLLRGDRALDRGDDRRKFQEHAVARGIDDPSAMAGDDRPQRLHMPAQRIRCAGLIVAHETGISRHVGNEYRR